MKTRRTPSIPAPPGSPPAPANDAQRAPLPANDTVAEAAKQPDTLIPMPRRRWLQLVLPIFCADMPPPRSPAWKTWTRAAHNRKH